jgi:hypothetical protein
VRKVLERELADRGAELARLNQERASDQAELVAEQVHVNELSQQLKTATTNIDMERQLATAGKDVCDLMGARQLHVVDVRDTDPNGKAGNAKKIDAKQTYQVWGQQEGKASSPRSLGFLC